MTTADDIILYRNEFLHIIFFLNFFIRGNQYVHVKVQIPKKVNAKQVELLKQFEEEEKQSNPSASSSSTSFIQDALKRLKNFMGVSSDKSSTTKKEAGTASQKT